MVRALCGYSGFICFLIAIQFLPLADAVSLSFATPLFMVVWAALFLGESVRWRRATATAIGFVGVVVMMRPGQAAIEPAALVAILGAMFGATAMTLIKRLTVHDDNVTLMASFAIVAGIAGVGPALWVWQMPGWSDLPWLAAIGLGGVAGQYMLIRAYRAGEASVVAPFDYSRLILSTILGYLVFREVPDLWTGVGAAIIIASTFYIARREARRGIAPAVTPGGGVNP
ncbi:MAG: DMT family transporter [Alphaproteobacteria bacterium]